jgi:hypothetical protein
MKTRIQDHLRDAKQLGFAVSQRAEDVIHHQATPGQRLVCHLTTLHGEVIDHDGRARAARFLYCEVRHPEPVCPCGQLTVDWDTH